MLTYARDVVVVSDALGEEPVPDLPGEDGGALALIVRDLGHDGRRRHARLGAANRARLDRSSLIVPVTREVRWKSSTIVKVLYLL